MDFIKKYYSTIVLIIFSLFGINHFIFERYFFFNELLSLVGGLFLISQWRSKSFAVNFKNDKIYASIIFLIGLLVAYSIASLFFKTNWYYYLRNTSLVYSVFSFFVGYCLYKEQAEFYQRFKKWIYGFSFLALFLGTPNLIDRNSYATWFALFQKDLKWKSIAIFSLLCFIYTFSYTSLTVVMIWALVLGISLLPNYKSFLSIFFLGICSLALIINFAEPMLSWYHGGHYGLFGRILHVYNQHQFFHFDHNSSWRLLFWYRLLVEDFPQNLVGIGIGTPLVPYLNWTNTQDLGQSDEYIAHVIGAHNTFITFFYRFGIIAILLLGRIYHLILKEFYQHRQLFIKHKNDLGLFLAFITITTVGVFNLLLETPTLASFYWVLLGFVAQAIQNRKAVNNEV